VRSRLLDGSVGGRRVVCMAPGDVVDQCKLLLFLFCVLERKWAIVRIADVQKTADADNEAAYYKKRHQEAIGFADAQASKSLLDEIWCSWATLWENNVFFLLCCRMVLPTTALVRGSCQTIRRTASDMQRVCVYTYLDTNWDF